MVAKKTEKRKIKQNRITNQKFLSSDAQNLQRFPTVSHQPNKANQKKP